MKSKRVIYEFDDFRVDSGQFLLSKQGHTRPLTPTVFRILLYLLENADQVVTKDRLMSAVWPDSFVEEGNLNRNISTLRKALGEAPSDHRYIETVPKTGYRFVTPVRQLDYQPATAKVSVKLPPARRPVIGRDVERHALRLAFQSAKDGRGGILCVSGEVGMGKTTLIDSFVSDLKADDETFHFASSRCSDTLTDPEPYGPFLECLSALAKTRAIGDVVRNYAPTWHREIFLAPDDAAIAPANVGRMKREASELLQAMTSTHPAILVIDDFHFADTASVDLLTFLSTRLQSMPAIVIVCIRPADLIARKHVFSQTRSQLLGSGNMQEIQLAPLAKDHIEGYISKSWPSQASRADVAGIVMARSEGNPLFMVEVLRSLKEEPGFASKQDAVPDSLRNLIRGRLDPLDEVDRGLLAAASVQGFEFDSAILAKSLGMEAEAVEEKLQELADARGLIRRLREEELMDGKFTVRYQFAHSLYQTVCNKTLPPTRRASLSSAVAEAFLAFYGASVVGGGLVQARAM